MAKSQPSLLYPSLIFSGILLFGGLSVYSVLREPNAPVSLKKESSKALTGHNRKLPPAKIAPSELAKIPPSVDYTKVNPPSGEAISRVPPEAVDAPRPTLKASVPLVKPVRKALSASKRSAPDADFSIERKELKSPTDFSFKSAPPSSAPLPLSVIGKVPSTVEPPGLPIPSVSSTATTPVPSLGPKSFSASTPPSESNTPSKKQATDPNRSVSVYVEPLAGTPPSAVAANDNKAWIKVSKIKTIVINKGDVYEGFGKYLGADSKGANFEQGSIPFNPLSK